MPGQTQAMAASEANESKGYPEAKFPTFEGHPNLGLAKDRIEPVYNYNIFITLISDFITLEKKMLKVFK